jgi:hypothetical protein
VTPRKPPLHVLVKAFSVDDLARSLAITPTETVELFRSPRFAGHLAERWGTYLFGYERHRNSNFAGSDGKIALGPIGRFNISVRSFSRSLKFQQSKFMGSGRDCSPDDLIQSLELVERVIAVDPRGFPEVAFYPIDSKLLLGLVRDGFLTRTGMTARRFDEWVAATFDVRRIVHQVAA